MNTMLTMEPRPKDARLLAPVRNRYFYGKLLDADHLEMEQRYFLDMGRLVNRLTLGSGVLCGLRVRPAGRGKVVVSPGVAVDGYGREIIVTETVTLDLETIETEHRIMDRSGVEEAVAEADSGPMREVLGPAAAMGGHLGPSRRPAGAVLCLSYHECDVEPAPVLVADCDLREECVPGVVRERFKFELMDAAEAPWPEDPCSITRGVPAHTTTTTTTETTSVDDQRAVLVESLKARPLGTYGERGQTVATTGSAMDLRGRLCAAFHPPCGPGSACVPVALLSKGADGIEVDECAPRRTIYSNTVLLDLILCLAEEVERCCNRKVTLTAPKVVNMWPEPGQTVTLADYENNKVPRGGIAISFDRAMDQTRLESPDEWLRILFVSKDAAPVPLELTLEQVTQTTLDGGEGQTAYYAPITGTRRKLQSVANMIGNADGETAWALVLIRSDDVTQIVAADDGELLDPDFHGTTLTTELVDLLWSLGELAAAAAIGTALLPRIATQPDPAPHLPSGNGFEGGVLHASFQITA